MAVGAWTGKELLDRIAAAAAATRAHPDAAALGRVLIELEDLAARLRAGETLTPEYRQGLFFDVVALRELDNVDDSHLEYLSLLSEIAAAVDEVDLPPDR